MSRRACRIARRENNSSGSGDEAVGCGEGMPFPRGCDAATVKSANGSSTRNDRTVDISHLTHAAAAWN
jgi:hypothetical protein